MVEMNYELARLNMIEQQVRPWEVLDQRVLDLMTQIRREEFVPPPYRALAFTDVEIPLGHSQTMLSPKLVGRLLQALAIRPSDMVLEVGSGSGYVTALLASLARHVYSVELEPELLEQARANLARARIENITLAQGDAACGWPTRTTYDVIAVTGSLPGSADHFEQQLAIGGRLFVVLGSAPVMEAFLVTRLGQNDFRRESLFETVLPVLTNAPVAAQFQL